MEELLVPIFVCVVLPIAIVLIVGLVRKNETNRRAEVMLKAIENGQTIDPEIFARPKKKQSIKHDLLEKLNGACITSLMGVAFLLIFFFGGKWANSFFPTAFYLIAGGVLLAVGIGLFITYFTGKKMMANEIEAEEKGLLNKE
ncbi:MAG: hypothetical protein IKS47_02790 [Bacteroidales bacterium]|nr:hypothetical protein [Bacteroidales bacterium]